MTLEQIRMSKTEYLLRYNHYALRLSPYAASGRGDFKAVRPIRTVFFVQRAVTRDSVPL